MNGLEELSLGGLSARLREELNAVAAASQLLTGLVEGKGSREEKFCFRELDRRLHTLLRLTWHLDVLDREDLLTGFRPVDLYRLLDSLARETASLDGLGAAFRWDGEEGTLMARGDPYLLQLALLNLLTNAFLAARERGDGKGEVTLRWKRVHNLCRVSIRDNGRGIAGEEPRWGMGLGVRVARRCLESHGGFLLTNSSARGVAHVVTIPLAAAEEPAGMAMDRTGGYSPLLVEYAPLLSAESWEPEG